MGRRWCTAGRWTRRPACGTSGPGTGRAGGSTRRCWRPAGRAGPAPPYSAWRSCFWRPGRGCEQHTGSHQSSQPKSPVKKKRNKRIQDTIILQKLAKEVYASCWGDSVTGSAPLASSFVTALDWTARVGVFMQIIFQHFRFHVSPRLRPGQNNTMAVWTFLVANSSNCKLPWR